MKYDPSIKLEGVDEIDIVRAFHGHLGPYVVAGHRMGKLALAKLDADPYFGIETDVWAPGATPHSCFIDGLQLSTGCTLGKQNIHHHLDEVIRAKFTDLRTFNTIEFRLRLEPIREGVAVMKAATDVEGAQVILDASDEALFEEIEPE